MEEESTADLFVHCRLVFALFYLLLPLMGISWVLGVWKLMPLAIWWGTRRERNCQIFEVEAGSFQDFKRYFLRTLYRWSQVLSDCTRLTFWILSI